MPARLVKWLDGNGGNPAVRQAIHPGRARSVLIINNGVDRDKIYTLSYIHKHLSIFLGIAEQSETQWMPKAKEIWIDGN
jgi:hypothetical protein